MNHKLKPTNLMTGLGKEQVIIFLDLSERKLKYSYINT